MPSLVDPAMYIPKTDGQSSTPDEGAAQTPTPKEVTPRGLTSEDLARPEPMPPLRPTERAVPDARKPVAVAIYEQASDEGAAKGPDPQAELAEPEPISAATSVTASAAKDIADTASGEESCNPERVFVFGHPEVAAPLLLRNCVKGPDGPARLQAPPLTNPLIDLIQRHLNDLGYNAGPVDGLIGPRTRAAVRRFQRDQGDAPTGAITFALLERIVESTATDGTGARVGAVGE